MAHLHLTAKERVRSHRALMPNASRGRAYENFMSRPLSAATIREIEEMTRGQRNNPVWDDLRKGVISASYLLDVVRHMRTYWHPDRLDGRGFMYQDPMDCVMNDPVFFPAAMDWARAHKEEALRKYWDERCHQLHDDFELRRPGMFMSKENPLLGASPTAAIFPKNIPNAKPGLLIQVMCPYKFRNDDPYDAAQMVLNVDQYGKVYVKRSNNKNFQLQALMGVVGVDSCDVVVYTKKGICVGHVQFDQQFFDDKMYHVDYFARNFLYPRLFEAGN